MSELLQLTAGSEVRCTDGRVGHVRGLVFDPQARAVTHLSVEASSVIQNGRLVPLEAVQSAGSVIELGCTREDYYGFPPNEDLIVAPSPGNNPTRHVHLVPQGETDIGKDEDVYAVDGRAGHLIGIAVDQADHAARKLLVQVGHFASRRQVWIPFDAVTAVDAGGVHLQLSKDEVSNSGPL